ncbi:MAG: NTPase [Phycisphaerae bacterium]|nr:NTPase [Phycisphaerae bacterium]
MTAKILLTGRPGCGKTTVVLKVVAIGIPVAGGFVTEEIRRGSRRLGFEVRDLYSGARAILSHVDRRGPPRVGKYGVDVTSFDRIGVAALWEAIHRRGCILIDEIGKMELCSKSFQDAVTAAMNAELPLLATVPAYAHPFLDTLRTRQDVTVIEVMAANRDELPARLVELLGFQDLSR